MKISGSLPYSLRLDGSGTLVGEWDVLCAGPRETHTRRRTETNSHARSTRGTPRLSWFSTSVMRPRLGCTPSRGGVPSRGRDTGLTRCLLPRASTNRDRGRKWSDLRFTPQSAVDKDTGVKCPLLTSGPSPFPVLTPTCSQTGTKGHGSTVTSTFLERQNPLTLTDTRRLKFCRLNDTSLDTYRT